MHVYSIDKDIRRKVIVVIFGISIFISIIMKYLLSVPIEFIGECIKKVELLKILLQIGNVLDVFLDIISAPVIYAILYWWFDKKLWKTEYINKVLQIPDLNGEWTGKAKSSFGDNNEYTMKLTIKQTWSKISFVALFPDTNSKSESNCASFFIETNGDKKIGFGFVNRSREVSAQQYDGYNVLELDSENEIAGRYFNNRDNSAFGIDGGNKGQFKLTRGTSGKLLKE